MLKGVRIGVLMGGVSAERDISIMSGKAVSRALRSMGLDVVDIDAGRDVCEVLGNEKIDLAFIALHGGYGENGAVQGMLEVMGIPYTGSGIMASAMAMDKLVSKTLFKSADLKVPDYIVVDEVVDSIPMKLPVVVKPANEGSSIGVSIVQREDELRPALMEALKYDGPALVEKYIFGKEIQIGVLCGKTLGGVEVRPKAEFYNYEAKYTAGMTEYIMPPELSEQWYERAREAGLAAHQAIGAKGATRVDLIVDDSGEIYILEVNTIAGMTETSLLPKIAASAGMDFAALVEAMAVDGLAEKSGGK